MAGVWGESKSKFVDFQVLPGVHYRKRRALAPSDLVLARGLHSTSIPQSFRWDTETVVSMVHVSFELPADARARYERGVRWLDEGRLHRKGGKLGVSNRTMYMSHAINLRLTVSSDSCAQLGRSYHSVCRTRHRCRPLDHLPPPPLRTAPNWPFQTGRCLRSRPAAGRWEMKVYHHLQHLRVPTTVGMPRPSTQARFGTRGTR